MLIFNSKIEKPEYLEKLLVGRKVTADALEKSVITGAKYFQNIQHLIIGNRGSGKTHLMRVIFNRISKNAKVTDKYCIAYMAEEEIGIDSFFALMVRIIDAFIRWNDDLSEKKEWKSKIDILKEISPADREDRAKEYILSYLGEKQLLILSENINEIFEGMKPFGQARFRDFIQQTDKISIIATSQSLFADIQREDKPFHNFFQITHLNRLTRNETKELIIKLTDIEGSPELKAHLKTSKGIGQIRAIHFLSEGNHRLIALFFEFLKTDMKSNLTEPFLNTLDKLKPYYESFIRHLPPQQQKIIHFLALKHQPQLGSAIAKECFLTPGGTSKQMAELKNKGFVDAHRIGRDNKYELKEPMMRYCIELTDNRDGIIGMFARFITILYSDAEIINRYLKLKYLSNDSCNDIQEYKKQEDEVLIYKKAGENQTQNINHLGKHINSISDEKTKSAMVKIMMKISNAYSNCPIADETCLCTQFLNKKTDDDSILKIFITELVMYSLHEEAYKLVSFIKNNLEEQSEGSITSPIFFVSCLFRFKVSAEIMEKYLEKLLLLCTGDITGKLISVLLESHFRGNKQAIYDLTKDERAILEFIKAKEERFAFPSELLDIKNEDSVQRKHILFKDMLSKYPNNALGNLKYAQFLSSQKDINKAEKFFMNAIRLEPKNPSFKYDYGVFLYNKKDDKKLAAKFLKESIDIEPESIIFWSRYVRVVQSFDEKEAMKTYEKMQVLFPNSSRVYQYFGEFLFHYDNNQVAIEKLVKSIELDEMNNGAYYALGDAYADEGKHTNAIENYSKALDIDDTDTPIYLDRGISYFENEAYNKAIKDIEVFINCLDERYIKREIENSNHSIIIAIFNLFLLGIIKNRKNDINLAKKYLDNANLSSEINWAYELIRYIYEAVLSTNNYESVPEFLRKLNKIYETKDTKWVFNPLIKWIKNSKSKKLTIQKREYLLDLFNEIDLLQNEEII